MLSVHSTGVAVEDLIDTVEHWLDLWREALRLHDRMPAGVRAVINAGPVGPAAVLPHLIGLPSETIAETIELLELLRDFLEASQPTEQRAERRRSPRLRLVR